MTSICNEEDLKEETDEPGYNSLLCFLGCLTTDSNMVIPNERDVVIRQLSTRNSKHEPLLRQSLFKNHPPYIIFYKREKKNVEVLVKKPPVNYRSCMKWCESTLLSRLMKQTLRTSHFELVSSDTGTWRGFWGKHLRTAEYKTLTYWQKVNHFPGDFHIGRKDRLWQHLLEMQKHFPGQYDIMPKSYVLPKDFEHLRNYLATTNKHVIIKPPASARGRGISIVNRIEDVKTDEPVIAQHYIENPLLVNGSKFDLRIYVYVSNLNPLLVYIYSHGLVRFASVPYNSEGSFDNEFMHLTNFSINKMAKKNGVTDTNVSELKWSLDKFWDFVEEQGRDPKELWDRIKDVAVKAVISTASAMLKQQASFCPFSFLNREVFGMDVMIDSDFKPWILEMNISPSMQTATDEDTKVKAPLIADILNMWRQEFVHQNDVEAVDLSYRCKPIEIHKSALHIAKETENLEFYTNTGKISPNILKNLSDSDMRYLMDFEDEYALRGDFELIFPAPNTIGNYLPQTEPTYSNLLITAWISLPDNERKIGIERLKTLSEAGAHLSEEGFVNDEDDESVMGENAKFSDYASM